jgi:hypothetical protein
MFTRQGEKNISGRGGKRNGNGGLVADDFAGDHENDPLADVGHTVGDPFQVVADPDQVDGAGWIFQLKPIKKIE